MPEDFHEASKVWLSVGDSAPYPNGSPIGDPMDPSGTGKLSILIQAKDAILQQLVECYFNVCLNPKINPLE